MRGASSEPRGTGIGLREVFARSISKSGTVFTVPLLREASWARTPSSTPRSAPRGPVRAALGFAADAAGLERRAETSRLGRARRGVGRRREGAPRRPQRRRGGPARRSASSLKAVDQKPLLAEADPVEAFSSFQGCNCEERALLSRGCTSEYRRPLSPRCMYFGRSRRGSSKMSAQESTGGASCPVLSCAQDRTSLCGNAF